MEERETDNQRDAVGDIYWRDEILQLMYWMTGEGFGQEFTIADLKKFLQAEDVVLAEHLESIVANGFVERSGEKYRLTPTGQREGGRRFADGFEEMLRPGHFECDEPDCDCHNPESVDAICKHLSPQI